MGFKSRKADGYVGGCHIRNKVKMRRRDALRLAIRISKREVREDKIEAYKCRECGEWHVGHLAGARKEIKI